MADGVLLRLRQIGKSSTKTVRLKNRVVAKPVRPRFFVADGAFGYALEQVFLTVNYQGDDGVKTGLSVFWLGCARAGRQLSYELVPAELRGMSWGLMCGR